MRSRARQKTSDDGGLTTTSTSDLARRRARSLAVIITTFIVLLVVSLAASYAAIFVVDATRAYATGEGRYSKAQKIAVISLYRFAYSGQQADFDAFLAASAIPLGDRKARLALESARVDVEAARAGFLAGQNDPEDIGALIALFRMFSWWGPFAAALEDWREGDQLVGELIEQAVRLKQLADSGGIDAQSRGRVLGAIDRIDDRLTDLENTFSTHMGEAARAATRLVVIGLGVIMVLLWVAGMAFAARLFRQQLALDRQLRDSEQRFRDYADAASDWYWEMDADHRITYISEQFFAVTEASPDTVLQRPFDDFVAAYADSPENQVQRAALAREAQFRDLHLRYPRRDGSIAYLSLSGRPYFDAEGRPLGYRGIGSDITASVKEAELIQARQNAEAANQAKSNFVATMSHEIRTPMNGVLGTTRLLARTRLDERQARLVAIMQRSGQALMGVINDILDFSKIEAGRFELDSAPFDIREVVAEVVDLFNGPASNKGLELIYFVSDSVPRILIGDGMRLRQILVNLVSNALKFTDRGEILIELNRISADAKDVTIDFAVSDTGIGIPPEKHQQVFEHFQQVDASMTRARGGSGLGLAIAKQLVEMMGGTIGVDSTVGRGSRFHFTVRCTRAAAHRPVDRALDRKLHALLVDANAVSAGIIARHLARWNVGSVSAQSIDAAELAAVKAAGAGRLFDVAFIDIKGLGRGGIDLARRLVAGDPSRQLQIVFLVGLDSTLSSNELADVSPAGILVKPARETDLFDCLATIATGNRQRIAASQVSASIASRSERFDVRVMLVEDNAVNLEVASGILEFMECQIVTAPNGQAAVDLFRTQTFDLILMDCEMPVMDGLAATRQIRALESGGRKTHVPIVALTAHALQEMRDRCLAAGMDDFLGKPFDEVRLGEMMRRWLPAHDAGRSVGDLSPSPSNTNAVSPIDAGTIERLRAIKVDGGTTLLSHAFEKFRTLGPSQLDSIRVKTAEGDAETVWRTAHSLKSSAASLGALGLSQRCAEIERLAVASGAAAVVGLLDGLEAEFSLAMHALEALAGTGGSTSD